MPPMDSRMPMIPGLERARPSASPFLPGRGLDPAGLPEATYREVMALADGDTVALRTGLVRRSLQGRSVTMYGFNGQYPGPIFRVPQDATIFVDFRNEIELPSTVHWHGVRVENRFDGVPGVTQEPVEPGARFLYEVHFEDAGIYWYHPHVSEHLQQDLGLYGSLLIDPASDDYYGPANREEVLVLDDLLIDDQGLYPWGTDEATHALMGRFGNLMLVNGEASWERTVAKGEVVRFYLTNVSNTRTFNLSFGGARMKVVAADIGRFEREAWVASVPIAPAQRYVVDVRFDREGEVALVNRIQAINHFLGEFYPHVDTLGIVEVSTDPIDPDYHAAFETLRENHEVQAELEVARRHLARPPDRELSLDVRQRGLPAAMVQMMVVDTVYAPPLELNDAMPMMNWLATSGEVTWIVRDRSTGRENMEVDGWKFEVGDLVKIRITNDPTSLHPMNHPIHIHGQRTLVLSRDGLPNSNLAWKDTVIVPVGSSYDLLVEMSNPGLWMLHCHIAEHLEAGMMMVFEVTGESAIH